MKKFFIATAIVVAGSTAAQSADLPARVHTMAPPPVAVYSWTGCYIGGNAGWIGGDRIDLYPSGSLADPAIISPVDARINSHNYTPQGSATVGAQIGCNWQMDRFVVGAEADFNASFNQNASETFGNLPKSVVGNWTPHTENVSKKLDWFSTYRLRAGYAFDRFYIYGTGGFAVGRFNAATSYDAFTVNNFSFAGSTTSTRFGYAVGAGLEYLMTERWTLKAEYLYLDFGSFSFDSPNILVASASLWGTTVRAREHVARAGINYKFDWAVPVVAKY